MSELDEFKATYFDECSELLGELEEQFAAIEAGERDPDRLNAVFRAIHSIKGGAGAFGFSNLVAFAHTFETLLDNVRDETIELTDAVVVLCIRAVDLVADFVTAARNEEELGPDFGAAEKEQFELLCNPDGGGAPVEEFDIEFTPVSVALADAETKPDAFEEQPLVSATQNGRWQIDFTPHSVLYERANDPILILRELGALGTVSVVANVTDFPPLAAFDPFGVYCSWRVELVSKKATEATIHEVFEFVEGDCDLTICELAALDPETAAAAPETEVEGQAGDQAGDQAGVQAEEEPVTDSEPSFADLANEIAPPQQKEPNSPAGTDKSGPAAREDKPRQAIQSIRVDLEKVDRVVNMVGELVITQSMLSQQMDDDLREKYQELIRGLEVLEQTTRGLQDSVMAIRAQPVKSVFSRLPRLMRELATKTGKKIRLEMVGEHTEIDKTVIEQLSDPLTHMIRNSADHGIEMPEVRIEAGKPETGVIRLSAEQSGGSILIAVEDDGAGINRERVLDIARERGVITPDQQLTEEQIDNLVFAPGFSTASAVSDISGRGVGMDVVLSNIKKIGGTVHVRSRPGKGTRMTLRLPLTLAVLDVMLVKVSGCHYVIPLSSIVETIQCARSDFGEVPSGARVMQVRGEYVQVVDMAERFAMHSGVDDGHRFVVLCEAEGSVKVALIVDEIVGQQQVVIKSLEENYQRVEGIAGGTILGDGSVALIVDVQGVRATSGEQKAA